MVYQLFADVVENAKPFVAQKFVDVVENARPKVAHQLADVVEKVPSPLPVMVIGEVPIAVKSVHDAKPEHVTDVVGVEKIAAPPPDSTPYGVVVPVPPLATGSAIPLKVTARVPDVVTGEPLTDRKVGTVSATELTVPPPPEPPTHAPLIAKHPVAILMPPPKVDVAVVVDSKTAAVAVPTTDSML